MMLKKKTAVHQVIAIRIKIIQFNEICLISYEEKGLCIKVHLPSCLLAIVQCTVLRNNIPDFC